MKTKVKKKSKTVKKKATTLKAGRTMKYPDPEKRKLKRQRRKHGVSPILIRRAAIKVLIRSMDNVLDINKSGLYALGVMKTMPPAPAVLALAEAQDIVEEIHFQRDRLINYLRVNEKNLI